MTRHLLDESEHAMTDTQPPALTKAAQRATWATRAADLAPLRTDDPAAYLDGLRALINDGCPVNLAADVLGLRRSTLAYQIKHGTRLHPTYKRTPKES